MSENPHSAAPLPEAGSASPQPEAGPAPGHRLSLRAYALLLAALALAHLGLTLLAVPPSVVFGETPFGQQDYQTHYQQTHTIARAIRQFGHAWAYDPNMLAGSPAGLFFDVDNKAHGLFSLGLSVLGLPLHQGFNLFVLLSCLLAPFCLFWAAGLLGAGRRARLVVLLLAVLLWHFDSGPRFLWGIGMVSFATASHLSMPVLALFYRLIHDGGRLRHLLPLLLLLPLALLVHVWAFAVLALPMTALYLRQARTLGAAGHAWVWAVALCAIAGNLYWLWPALTHLHLLTPSGWLGQANPLYLITDYIGLVLNPFNTGFIELYTTFRYLALCGAALALIHLRRAGDGRFFPFALALGWLLFMTYGAALVPGLRETEPYRFIVPATFVAAVLAGLGLVRLWDEVRAARPAPPVRALLLVLLVLALPRALSDVVAFIPEVVPTVWPGGTDPSRDSTRPPPVADRSPSAESVYRLSPLPDDYLALRDALRAEAGEPGRILVEFWPLAEYLRWALDRPILGGFPERRTIFDAANPFREAGDGRLEGRALADYLVRYNVRYLLVSGVPRPKLELRKDLLQPLKVVGHHRIYRVRHLGNYFAAGSGTLSAGLNRVVVKDARPAPGSQSVVLRFHHLEGLRCAPGCTLSPVPTGGAETRVSFIRVNGAPTLPRAFTISMTY